MTEKWELQHSLYNTFQAESESAIRRFHAGYICRDGLKRELREADKKLTGALGHLLA